MSHQDVALLSALNAPQIVVMQLIIVRSACGDRGQLELECFGMGLETRYAAWPWSPTEPPDP